jgi:hypothetical protein
MALRSTPANAGWRFSRPTRSPQTSRIDSRAANGIGWRGRFGLQCGLPGYAIFFVGSKLYVLEGITSSMDAKHLAYDTLIATFKTI